VELHGTTVQIRHLIDEETKVGEARRQASALAEAHGLDSSAVGRVAIATTELATNLLRHGGGGELLLQAITYADSTLIEVLAIDRGKGMASVDRCMIDGYSTAGTAGAGLGAVRRLAQEFDVYSVAGEGTVVVARIGSDGRAAGRTDRCFGAVNVAVAGEIECGDSWRLAMRPGATAVMVADGLGHGPLAASAARSAVSVFEAAPFEAPSALLERAHRATAGSRGAAAACASIADDGAVVYSGVGNICGCLVSPEKSQGMVSHGGTLGLRVSRMQQFDYQRKADALLVMHSDGLSARWDLKTRAGLLQRHPAIVAAILYRDFSRGRDDSTVVVVR
jgi:anti-sigma regulatory factor (Ser/Thr protein kinase)